MTRIGETRPRYESTAFQKHFRSPKSDWKRQRYQSNVRARYVALQKHSSTWPNRTRTDRDAYRTRAPRSAAVSRPFAINIYTCARHAPGTRLCEPRARRPAWSRPRRRRRSAAALEGPSGLPWPVKFTDTLRAPIGIVFCVYQRGPALFCAPACTSPRARGVCAADPTRDKNIPSKEPLCRDKKNISAATCDLCVARRRSFKENAHTTERE